jgi:hypothetical protein
LLGLITRRRVLAVALLGAGVALLQAGVGKPASADTWSVNNSPHCVQRHVVWSGAIGTAASLRARFTIVITHPTGGVQPVFGRWEWTGPPTTAASGYWWSGPGEFHFGYTGGWNQSLLRVPEQGATGHAQFVVWANEHHEYGGCFRLENVTIQRTFIQNYPAPTQQPYPTNYPGGSYGPGATQPPLGPGECWIAHGDLDGDGVGDGHYIAPCEAPPTAGPGSTPPPPTTVPGAGNCPAIPSYLGTFSVHTDAMTGPCVLWAGYVSATGTLTLSASGTVLAPGLDDGCGGTTADWQCRGGIARNAGQSGGSSWPPPSFVRTTNVGESGDAVNGSSAAWRAISVSTVEPWSGTVSAGSWYMLRMENRRWLTFDGAAPWGARLTFTVGGTATVVSAGAPTPHPTWSTQPGDVPQATAPGGSTDGPAPPPDFPTSIEICAPGSIAADRAACAEPPTDVCEPGSYSAGTMMCATPGPFGSGEPYGTAVPVNVDIEGFDDVVAQLGEKAPFGYVTQVGGALEDAISGAAGGALDLCMNVPRWQPGSMGGTVTDEACLPMQDYATQAAPARAIALVLLTIGFALAMIKWAAQFVGGGGD